MARAEVRDAIGFDHAWLCVADEEQPAFVRVLGYSGSRQDLVWDVAPRIPVDGDPMMAGDLRRRRSRSSSRTRAPTRAPTRRIVAQLGNRTIVNVPLRLLDKPFGAFGCGTFGDEGVRVPEHRADRVPGLDGQPDRGGAARIRFAELRRAAEREKHELETRLLPRPEAREPGPARRRHRARLRQPADGHPDQRQPGLGPIAGSAGQRGAERDHWRRRARRAADAAAPRHQPHAPAVAPGGRPRRSPAQPGVAAAPRPAGADRPRAVGRRPGAARRRRPVAARSGADEPVHQRPRRDAGRRRPAHPHRGRAGRPGGPAGRRPPGRGSPCRSPTRAAACRPTSSSASSSRSSRPSRIASAPASGLAVVFSIVRQHGGSVTCTSDGRPGHHVPRPAAGGPRARRARRRCRPPARDTAPAASSSPTTTSTSARRSAASSTAPATRRWPSPTATRPAPRCGPSTSTSPSSTS